MRRINVKPLVDLLQIQIVSFLLNSMVTHIIHVLSTKMGFGVQQKSIQMEITSEVEGIGGYVDPIVPQIQSAKIILVIAIITIIGVNSTLFSVSDAEKPVDYVKHQQQR